mmetsp:Transcript_15734/g.28272  ORF Transcript_15734/g.28272 Transcript_15734/m.28272 type:complete len:208 (-) Transcript_15734:1684-2307(-)
MYIPWIHIRIRKSQLDTHVLCMTYDDMHVISTCHRSYSYQSSPIFGPPPLAFFLATRLLQLSSLTGMKFSFVTAAPVSTCSFFHSSISFCSCSFLLSYSSMLSSAVCSRCTCCHLLTKPTSRLSFIFRTFFFFFLFAATAWLFTPPVTPPELETPDDTATTPSSRFFLDASPSSPPLPLLVIFFSAVLSPLRPVGSQSILSDCWPPS